MPVPGGRPGQGAADVAPPGGHAVGQRAQQHAEQLVVPGRTADLDVPAAELARRKADLRGRPQAREVGWLSVYQRLVRPLPEGAVLRPRRTAS